MSAVCETRHAMRPMREDDLPRIERIELASYEYPWTLGNFADSLAAGYSMWVLEAESTVIGYYVMMAAAEEAHLLNLTVAPAWRRRGLGRDLLGHCMANACGQGASIIFLEVRVSNAGATALYRNSGFVDLAVRRAYYPAREGREDALIMKKDLPC